MQTKDINTKASQDVTIGELPKQDNPNNSDLVVIQGSSLTEATTIQQLRNKILGGSVGNGKGLGETIYSLFPIQDSSLLRYDGTEYQGVNYQQFFDFLKTQDSNTKSFFSLDIVAETFKMPNLTGLYPKAGFNSPFINTVLGLPNHTHSIDPHSHRTSLPTGDLPIVGANANNLPLQFYNGRTANYQTDSVGLKTNNHNLTSNDAVPYYTQYVYCRVVEDGGAVISSPFIKSNGSVSMDIDYTPTDLQDVATKKYIDFKFLDTPLPLSFSINDIGKIIPYYHKAEENPTLIALDGTKYLITDYPDFPYLTLPDFENDGVYFWKIQSVDFKNFPRYPQLPYVKMSGGTIESKLLYNYLQNPNLNFLLGDDVWKFKIIDASTFKVRLPNLNSSAFGGFDGLVGNEDFYQVIDYFYFTPTSTPASSSRKLIQMQYSIRIKPDYMVAKIQQVGGSSNIIVSDDVNFNGFKVTNLGAPVDGTDSARLVDLTSNNVVISGTVADSKVVKTLTTKLTEIDTNITNLDAKTNTVRVFPRRFLKTTGLPTNLTIGGNASKRLLDEVTIQNVIGYDSSTFTLSGTTNKIIKELITQPFTTKLLNIRISLSHTASMGNTQIQPTLWRVRNDDITTPTIVAGGTVIYNNDADARIVTTMINSIVVNGDNDPFVKYGYYLELKNLTGTALTYSSIDILITATCDRGLLS